MAENDEPMIQTPADFGHFLLEKELGHGGMGGVYLARDKMLDRRVGIKVMLKSLGADPKFVERFQREAQAAARLNHPNIAQIYSFGQEQGMPYIAMELVPGGSLDKEMEANPGTLDVAYVMRVGQQVADALALAAESGLVHGDVKPENVLFDADGNAKLVDFGLAAMQGDSDEIWGTPYYISPEKVRRQKIDYRADIYSLGGTLYHVLTGVPPFDGPDPTAVVKARFEGPPKKPSELRPEIPPEVDAIIMRMLELEPSMRYPTYQSLLGDFKRYLAKAGPAKAGKSSGPKLKFKGMKPKVSLSSTGNTETEGEISELPPVDNLEGEEEESHMGVGKMVGLVVGGIVLLLLLIGGALWWYVSSSKADKEQQNVQALAAEQQKARQSIAKTISDAKADYEAFHQDVLKADKCMEDAVREVKKALPDELKAAAAAVLDLPPTPEIAEAMAYAQTNRLFGAAVEQPAVAAKPAATNAAETASAEKKSDGKKEDGKKSEASKDDKPSGDKKAKAGDKKGTDKKADAKKGGKKASSKEDAEEDKDAEADKALDEAEAKAQAKSEGKEAKKDAKKPEKEEDKPEAEEKKADDEEEKKDEQPSGEPAAEGEKPPEQAVPAMTLPPDMKAKYEDIWKKVCQYRAADIKYKECVRQILEKAKEADALTGQDEETNEKLVKLANDLNAMYYTNIKNEKWLHEAKMSLQNIDARALNFRTKTVEKIQRIIEKHKQAVAAANAAAEKARAADEAAKALKEKIEEERQKAQTEFDGLANDIKRIEWERCTRQLTSLQGRMTTREGKDAVNDQLHKIEVMAGMQKHFIKYAQGFKFKNRRGEVLAVVTKVDDRSLTIQKAKLDSKGRFVLGKDRKPVPDREKRVEWDRFYGLKEKEYLGYMNRFIIELVERGQKNDKTRVGPREWSDNMLGAALTLHYLYGDKDGVEKFVPQLVQEAVKGFEPCRKWAVKWFPDVKLEEPVE